MIPELTGRRLTVDVALKQPSVIRDQIARLADDQLLLPRLFRPFGAAVIGGGLLYSVIAASDFFTTDVEKRTPGAEYKVVEGVEPEPKLAAIEDWGGKFQVEDERRTRNDVSYLDQQTTQLANTISRKLDTRAVEALQAAPIATVATSSSWDNLVFVGPDANLTSSLNRPSAHFAQAQELADLEELGIVHDTLLVNPAQARALRTAYAENLGAMLESVGLTMYSNPRIPDGTAFVCQAGMVGTVAFESPGGLVVETYDERSTRSTWVQSYAPVAIAVDRPYAAKKITGL
ncbi:major capsid protein [Mycolicibacterium smegmatis]|uniref:major capsid protein n=1 Tax=Mycolicibacterium smegmatis TaxID=1772 RepID=UPI001E2CB208|nr:major capsid protein [Mycolicibacterium smegmatis]